MVRVLTTPVISYAREIFDVSKGYSLVRGCGAIGGVLSASSEQPV